MKKCISASSALLVTAMMVTLSFGCGETADSESGYSGLAAEQSKGNSKGTCNSIVARSLGTAQQCNKFGCSSPSPECTELSETFLEFFLSPADCGEALGMGELNGLPGNASTQPGRGPNAGGPKHIAEVICGAIEECGFCDDAQNLGGICLTTEACNAEYTQDFESLDQTDPDALGDDGWLAFGQVFDAGGDLKFGYGPFPAPNAAVNPSFTFFSAIVTGQGGPDQGDQQLSVFNDYNCCEPLNPTQGHFNGTDRVQSNVFQTPRPEGNTISAADIGQTLTFTFDARATDPPFGVSGATTALAYIQTLALDPGGGVSRTNFVTVDMTNLPTDAWNRYTISLPLTDPLLIGQILQVGFQNTAQNFEASGNFYDNIRVVLEAP